MLVQRLAIIETLLDFFFERYNIETIEISTETE